MEYRTFEPPTEQATALIGADFALGLSLDWQVGGDRPSSGQGVAVEEDVLQTFLWLHTAEITGEPITIFGKSGFYWGMADLLGVDPLGRIHLFELKKTTVNATVALQLEQYLLGYVLQDASVMMDEWRGRTTQLLGEGRDGLLVSLAGAHAGVRTDTKGRKLVAKTVASLDPNRARQIKRPSVWRGLKEEEKVRLLVDALIKRACRKRRLASEVCPTFDNLREVASQWRPRLDPAAALASSYPRLQTRAVVWLVGPRVDESARERVRQWRRGGLDARWLELRVVAMNRQVGWELYAAREHAPHRSQVVRDAIEWLGTHTGTANDTHVRMHLYASRPASHRDSNGKDLDGGRLLHRCRVVIDSPGMSEIEFAASAPEVPLTA